jgi:signal transduction histidine kinase
VEVDPLLTSQATLLLALGMSGYLGALHVWYTRRARDPHLWVGVWSIAAVASQVLRLVQLQAKDPETAVAVAHGYAALAPLLIASLCGFARALSGRATPRRELAAFVAGNAALVLAIGFSDAFISHETSPARDWFGAEYIGVSGRPPLLVLPVYMLWACAWVVGELRRSSELTRREYAVLVASLLVYAAMGLSSVASSLGVIDGPGAAEYGPVALGLGLSFLLVHRRRRLEDSLQSLVEARTAELAASESRYRGLIENAPIGIFACDPLGRITTRNPRLFEILGKPPGADRPDDNVLSHRLGIAAGVAETVRLCLSRGEVITAEHRYTSSWGRTADVRLILAPLRGNSGAITGALGLVEDVSERRTLEEGLRRSQKLESVGQLAAGIAHEINNPMAFVRTNLAVLREEWHGLKKELGADTPELSERFGECEALIDESLEGIERTIAIARDMREFAHSGGVDRAAVDINQLVESCVRFASPHCKGATRIDERYAPVPPVWGSSGQLRQVFVNLLVNALQAVGQVGTVRVETALAGEWAVVRVSDDGAGVLPEHLDRLFDPFFTTKPAGEGTGLGLYVSHEIVQGHGGEIIVESTPGQGATFEVRLPLAAEEGAGPRH